MAAPAGHLGLARQHLFSVLCFSSYFALSLQIFNVLLASSVSDSLFTGSLAVVSSVLLSQSHFVVGYDSVARFWLPPTSLLSVCALRD